MSYDEHLPHFLMKWTFTNSRIRSSRMTWCSLLDRYQSLGGNCCLHHQGRRLFQFENAATCSSNTLIPIYQVTHPYTPEDSCFSYSMSREPQISHLIIHMATVVMNILNTYLASKSNNNNNNSLTSYKSPDSYSHNNTRPQNKENWKWIQTAFAIHNSDISKSILK
jgi:hypothetical protein